MKHTMLLLLVLTATTVAFALKKDPAYREARLKGALAKMQLRIADDGGNAVADANVDVFMGMNFRDQGYWIRGRTDTNGVFNVAGKTCGDAIEIYLSKEGYYDSMKTFRFATMGAERDVKDGKWQPYGENHSIVLRRVQNPQTLKIGKGGFVLTKHLDRWLGFDMQKHDFVHPYGTGDAVDFEVKIEWNGKWLPNYTGMGVHIRFTTPYSGYYECPINSASELKGPYTADTKKNYRQTATFDEQIDVSLNRIQHNFDERKCWVVRSRCKVDKEGRLISANYSVVHKVNFCGEPDGRGGFRITGAFNPTPNDTNLEPKR